MYVSALTLTLHSPTLTLTHCYEQVLTNIDTLLDKNQIFYQLSGSPNEKAGECSSTSQYTQYLNQENNLIHIRFHTIMVVSTTP